MVDKDRNFALQQDIYGSLKKMLRGFFNMQKLIRNNKDVWFPGCIFFCILIACQFKADSIENIPCFLLFFLFFYITSCILWPFKFDHLFIHVKYLAAIPTNE